MKPTILVAYDFSHAADEAIRWVADLQGAVHGKTHVVHVIDTIALATVSEVGLGAVYPGTEELEVSLKALVQRAGIEGEARVVLGAGIGPTLLDLARETGADLIATGTHGRGFVGRVVMGSVAEYLLHNATVPVIIFRQPKTAGA
jgi:nucleotide-binding universal stress UspA family protein